MFNTFSGDHHESTFGKKQNYLMKQRLIELNNLSTIQLNPWNEDPSKSPLYEQNDAFLNFAKPNIKNSALIKYAPPKQVMKKNENKTIFERKKIDPKNFVKRQTNLIRNKKKLSSHQSTFKTMNKTISVNNFEGEKMFGKNLPFQRRQKIFQREQTRHRTTISNPMYSKFCINYSNDKQIPEKSKKSKKIQSDDNLGKFENIPMKEMINFRTNMSDLSIVQGDHERAKSIHQVRRRLKSTSEIIKRMNQNSSIQDHEITLRMDRWIFCEKPETQKKRRKSEYVNLTQANAGHSFMEAQRLQSSESGQNFQFGRRKNLYIGFRKFFNQGLNLKERPLQRKDSFRKEIVNLDALMKQGQGEVIRKFEKFEEYAFEKSYQRNLN